MQIYIPALGDQLIVEEDWTFDLHNEHRNSNFIKSLANCGFNYKQNTNKSTIHGRYGPIIHDSCNVMIPRGRALSISRIYIRNGAAEFNSVTFRLLRRDKNEPYGRFWVKLADANQLRCIALDAISSRT